ncbi:LysR family transcriptional regulator ArgP [Cellulomonas sp. ICMP 17802]|uniref:LysR family transcriptional regulator ArgP n=1 Tax=Cellulomonas sp. ICMP 17802 TaxID=3239199 RepID=UPI00351ACAD4
MAFDADQLSALAAVVHEGSFDAAAQRLHVTPSAVSQRIKALEQQVGRVLVLRTRPCRPTEDGEVLVRLAGQVELLGRDALGQLVPAPGGPRSARTAGATRRLPVAVNDDSMSTWFPAAVADLPPDVLLDLRREDQDLSADLLRDGTVMAAVTADPRAVQGCRVRRLGAMRYLAVAAPEQRDRWFADGLGAEAFAAAPLLAFNREDGLQERFVASVVGRRTVTPLVHFVPSQSAFVGLIEAGLGWGMVPEAAATERIAAGALVEVRPGRNLDVPLYWQHWALRTPTLDDLTERVVRAASAALRPVPRHGPPGGA